MGRTDDKKKSEVRSSVDMPGKGEERRDKEMCKEDRGYVEDSDERGWDGEPRGRREGGGRLNDENGHHPVTSGNRDDLKNFSYEKECPRLLSPKGHCARLANSTLYWP